MKATRHPIVFLTILLIITACQRDTILQETNTGAGGSLAKTASGDCAPITVSGMYVPGTVLSSANYLDVQANFSNPGNYEIKSDTINGYSFEATGQATSTGSSTVRLFANGTPSSAGINVFSIRFDTSICKASITVSPLVAIYTFGNAAGVCSGVTIGGTYTIGVALVPANTVDVQVNVTTLGAYSMVTNTVDGMTFANSGSFTSPGTQTVHLAGSGTPPAAGAFTFNTAATAGCSFTINVAGPVISLPTLTTTAANSISCYTAVSGGNITNDGGAPVTARGICYGTALNPTTANTIVTNGNGTGSFTSNLTGLSAGTTYHVRAFATNSAGTAYGNDIGFTTTTGCIANIYVAGFHDLFNISGNIRQPKVWANTTGSYSGTALPFTPNAGTVEAYGVFASGSDVYVAGVENGTATLWKNGTLTSLSTPPSPPIFYYSSAKSVYVSGTDVYATGYSHGSIATVWKNGVATNLTDGNFMCEGLSVFISGTDVYIAGYETKMIASNAMTIATVWKNGVAIPLTTGAENAVANSVFVSGTDVYVAGKEGKKAKVWKNGVVSTLPVLGGNEAVANSIFVAGTDVYVAGTEDDGTSPNSYAKLWKNGVGTYLTISNTRNRGYSVYVIGPDVYVAGCMSNVATPMATVWKNGFATNLTSPSTDAMAFAIFVK